MKYSIQELKRQGKGFIFNVDRFFQTILPIGWTHKRLVQVRNDTVKETQLMAETIANMAAVGLKNKKDIKESVTNFTKKYGGGLADTEISKKLPHGQNLLRNRVEDTLLYENAKNATEKFQGRAFIWLPSDAKEPRHSHMLRYGKVYIVGKTGLPSDDDFPGKAYGCKCGYQWVDGASPSEYSTNAEKDVGLKKRATARKRKK